MFSLGSFKPTEQIEFDGYVIRKLTPDDVNIDYAAFMSSIDTIRKQRGGMWPTSDFTIAENLGDLTRHQREFESGTSFAYIVTNREGSESFGCVYFYPVGHPFNSAEVNVPRGTDAVVNMWVTQKAFDQGLYYRLYGFVGQWVQNDWPFKKPFFSNPLKPTKNK